MSKPHVTSIIGRRKKKESDDGTVSPNLFLHQVGGVVFHNDRGREGGLGLIMRKKLKRQMEKMAWREAVVRDILSMGGGRFLFS
jgi:hypothetical protein